MRKNALLMYSCDWFKGGLWRYAHNLALNILKLDNENIYKFIHGLKKPENFSGLENNEIILPLSGWQKIRKLPKILAKEEFDLIHQTENFCPYFLKKEKYRKIVTIHDLNPLLFPRFFSRANYLFYRFYLPLALRTVDKIIVPSFNTKKDLVNFYGLKEEKINVIYNGIEKNFFDPRSPKEIKEFKKEHGIDSPYLLSSTINYHRNLPTVFKAYKSLPKELHEKYKIAIVGATGLETRNKIKFVGRGTKDISRSIQELGLADRIIFTGQINPSEMPLLYQGAEMLVFSSVYEGFGFFPLEAMASSCPVVCSNASSLPEVVGEGGILLDPFDIGGWRDAIARIVSSPELRKTLIEKGRKQAEKFSWEKNAKEHLNIYQNG